MIALFLLIFLGAFLAVTPVVAVAAPQIPGFFGTPRRGPARTFRTQTYYRGAAPSWA
jgi:hypothetical protein